MLPQGLTSATIKYVHAHTAVHDLSVANMTGSRAKKPAAFKTEYTVAALGRKSASLDKFIPALLFAHSLSSKP